MGEVAAARPVPSDRSVLVDALAAITVGVVFAVRGLPLAAQSGFADLVQGAPVRAAALASALLAVAVAASALLTRLPGWPVAAAGLLLAFLADLVPGADGSALLPTEQASTGQLLAALAGAAGTGLALGGALLAVGQVSRPARWPIAAGLAAGLVLHPVSSGLVHAALPDRYAASGQPSDVQLWIAVLATVFAALVAHRRSIDAPSAGAVRLRPGPVIVVAVAALLTLLGLLLRWWVVQQFRLSPDGFAGPRRERAVEAFAHFSTVAVAMVVGLVLLGYAYRAGRAVGARWVVLCVAAGPISLFGLRLDFASSPQRAYLVTVAGVVALTAGAALARYAARLLPWDAFGVALAAVALPLASPVVRVELPSSETVQPVLTAIGLGLALGFGLAFAATGSPGPDDGDDACRPVGLLVLGPAGWVLSAQALAPVVVRAQFDGPYQGPSLTIPVFAGVAALVLVLFFGFGRVVDRIRRDLRADAAMPSSFPSQTTTAAPAPAPTSGGASAPGGVAASGGAPQADAGTGHAVPEAGASSDGR